MIYEAVITTRCEDGKVRIAPLGYKEQDDYIVLSPFRPSTTLSNLERTGEAVLNLTDNVAVIAGCLTGHYDWETVSVDHVDGERLADTIAHLELKVERVDEDEVRPRFYCRIQHQENHKAFKGFNRAQSAVLEAAILVSRLSMLSAEKIDNELAYLQIAIDKTAGIQEKKAWDWLMIRIKAFRKEQSA